MTRAMGDVHPLGNPHYWLDPDNGRRIAKGIAGKLGELDPADAAYFQERFQDFDKRLTAAEQKWDAEMKPFQGRKVVTYHNSFPNFAKHFGLNVIGYVEPRPGYSSHAEPHHRTDRIDEAGELQGHPGRTLLRFEDPEFHRPRDRRQGRAVLAFGGRRKRCHRLLQALRLRYCEFAQTKALSQAVTKTKTKTVQGATWRFFRFYLAVYGQPDS